MILKRNSKASLLTTCAVALLFGLTLLAFGEKTPSASSFDHSHSLLTSVLQEFVTESGPKSFVKYAALKANPVQFNSYLESLSKISSDEYRVFTKDQKLAFLINAYNAFTVKLVLDHYPVKSIKDIGGIFSNPWKKKFFNLLGQKTHLDAIEHDMIRKDFTEPRIHFALVCASKGCPALKIGAFVAEDLDVQLNEAARRFLTDPDKNYYDESKKTLYLSSIFKWYGDDFSIFGSVKNFVAPFIAKTEEQQQILKSNVQISYLDYDWSLNEK